MSSGSKTARAAPSRVALTLTLEPHHDDAKQDCSAGGGAAHPERSRFRRNPFCIRIPPKTRPTLARLNCSRAHRPHQAPARRHDGAARSLLCGIRTCTSTRQSSRRLPPRAAACRQVLHRFYGSDAATQKRNPDLAQCYIAPTLLDQVPAGAAILSEEVFGPVLPILAYTSLDEVIAEINATPQAPGAVCLEPQRTRHRQGDDAHQFRRRVREPLRGQFRAWQFALRRRE